MQEKNLFICWVKEHKKELIIAGVSAAAIAAIILGYKNREYLISIISNLDKKVDSLPQPDVLSIATPLVGTTKVEPSIDIPEVTIHVLSDVPQESSPIYAIYLMDGMLLQKRLLRQPRMDIHFFRDKLG